MKKIIILSLSILLNLTCKAQQSNKAKEFLDNVYTQVNGYKNISIDFKYTLKNEEENIEQTTKGDVYIKGEQYLFNSMGVTQLYDGKKLYTVIPEDEEITISDASEEDDNSITPSKMLTFYKEGFNYIWDKKLPIQGRYIQYVKLIPIDTNSEFKHLLLGIDANTKNIYNLIQTGKNGTVTTITVNSFKTDQPLSESLFTFDRDKYKDYYFNE